MKTLTPIAIFAYNRPDHLRKLLESLIACRRLDECVVHFFCDGAKKPEHEESVMSARKVVHEYAIRLTANIVEQNENLGLARSIVKGVTELCERYGRVIVLEDDLILHPAFLDFMLQSLDRYENDDRVAQVAGFVFPIKNTSAADAFFLPLTTSWGWATWDRAWKSFSWDVTEGLNKLANDDLLRSRFDLDGAYPYFNMLCHAAEGKIDSWAIRWHMQMFFRDKLTLYPHRSLVWQNGFDDFATHTRGRSGSFQIPLGDWSNFEFQKDVSFPADVDFDRELFDTLKSFLATLSSTGQRRLPFSQVGTKLKNMLRHLVFKE